MMGDYAKEAARTMTSRGTGILREQNEKRVLSLLRKKKEMTRKELMESLKVSKNTVSIIVDQYIKQGVIQEIGRKQPNKAGRPTVLLKLNPALFETISMVIHPDSIEWSVYNYFLEPLQTETVFLDTSDVQTCVNQMLDIIEEEQKNRKNVIGVGIAVPGIVDTSNGSVISSVKLDWKNVPLGSYLKQSISLPFYIQNNVKVAALCAIEEQDEHAQTSFFYIRIGEGIGAAFVMNSQIWDGETSTAGEIGHLSVNPDGPECRCGQKGCLERLIGQKTFLEWTKKNGTVYEMQLELTKYGEYLSIPIMNIIHLLNPSHIIIDSPYNDYDSFTDSVTRVLEERSRLTHGLGQEDLIFNEEPYSELEGAALAMILSYEE
ncbi:ROK family transcriptional regulator [Bacillus sp. JCM 19041]|uniref:ROK family transcriptional regulator n=1 Tax=Bacillus sp. JCM 19041 TaxID=1460637 RepID=UPI0006D25914